jgi:ribose transport system ATP-binding protein
MGFIVNSELPIAATMFLEKLGPRFTLTRRVDTLSIAEKQLVEVARALSCNAKIIIFDEPTASLSERESKLLLSALLTLKNEQCSIVYISHRLPEVLQISDRIYGLRDGSNSGILLREEFSRDAIVQLMIGRQLREFFPYRERKLGEVALELRRFCATTQHQPLDLSLRQGEIVAIAGLVGSGRSELLEAIYGVRAAHSGSLHLSGTKLKCDYPGLGLAAGLRLVPESRKEHGLALDMSIQDSIASTSLLAEKTRIWRNQETEKATASYIISRFGINCSSPNQRLGLLSGGNQQKVVLARCLLGAAQVLLLDEPTRGVDLGAKSDIYKILFELAAEGSAILFVSSELEEIMGIADRAIVLAHGRRTGELLRSEFSENALIELAAKNQEYHI